MPAKIPTLQLPRGPRRPRVEQRPNAAARGYCDRRHRAWRLAVLRRDCWTCQACRRPCGGPREAHADHKSPVVHGTDRCVDGRSRYDVAAGQCLCASCHGAKTLAETRDG
jgi:hypothetical protein